jgi:DNA-3-methyladenine glycosylase II
VPLPTPGQLRALRRRDPVLARAMRGVPPFPDLAAESRRRAGTHFHALARAIIYQQLAGAAARTIHDRVLALTPGSRFPRPEEVLRLSPARLRRAGLSASKQQALRDLAGRATSGELGLRSIGRLPDQAIVDRLTTVRGIGEWSAQMFLLFRLGRLDVMPATDLGIREGVRRLDGLAERPTPAAVLERARPWHPVCSVASWVLWRLADGGGV